jgi:amino acid transporter/mannitol/fructose-specific phosphotransferase system IIA component (Ntr-type)
MQLKKELGFMDVFCIASGAMISSGLFVLPGLAHARAGTAVVFSYLLAGLLSLPGMLSLIEMTTAMPKAGGDCFAVIRSLGPGVGTIAGLLSWFSLSMKSSFALVGISVFAALIAPIDVHVTAVGFCLVFLGINLIGIKEAGRTQVFLVLALLALMSLYVAWGIPAVRPRLYLPVAPRGLGAVLSTSGFVFVSYAGLLKVASIAEEIRDPGTHIPRGMIVSIVVVSVFYTLMVLVTAGVLDPETFHGSLTPISDGASAFLGPWGTAALSVAAIVAFLTTANAGIMTSARSLVPLSRDGLLPDVVGRVNARFGTPHVSLFVTGAFVILTVFLNLEVLVEAASTVLILTNILACVSHIILRESRVQNYRPTFRAPLYPWLQALGIGGLGLLIVEMGIEAHLITTGLIAAGAILFFVYGKRRGKREYALLHLVEKITAKELTTHSLENELKEIIRERDRIEKDRFDRVVENCPVLDIDRPLSAEEFFSLAADAMAERLGMDRSLLFERFMERERESSTAITKSIAIPHIIVAGERTFDILIARCREGAFFSEGSPRVHTVFVLAGTKDDRNFHLVSLAAIAQIVSEPDFEGRWMSAKNRESLRDIVLLGKRKRT